MRKVANFDFPHHRIKKKKECKQGKYTVQCNYNTSSPTKSCFHQVQTGTRLDGGRGEKFFEEAGSACNCKIYKFRPLTEQKQRAQLCVVHIYTDICITQKQKKKKSELAQGKNCTAKMLRQGYLHAGAKYAHIHRHYYIHYTYIYI